MDNKVNYLKSSNVGVLGNLALNRVIINGVWYTIYYSKNNTVENY